MSDDQDITRALRHLSASDPVLARLIAIYPMFSPRAHSHYFQELASSIISQQLSVRAAATIEKRFVELFGGVFPSPEQILTTDADTLRSVGLSRPKAAYIADLAHHVQTGQLQIARLPELSNTEIIRELTAVKGIGEWTAHMFLMFALGRLDVLPVGDLGVRNAIKIQYGLDQAPTPEECHQVATDNHWHPYQSVAAWYLWQSLDAAP